MEAVKAFTRNEDNKSASIQLSYLTFTYLMRHTKYFNYFSIYTCIYIIHALLIVNDII